MTRKERLQQLIADRFGDNQAEFARAIGRSPNVVWQYLNGYREMGEKLARHIESRLMLPRRWMDGEDQRMLPFDEQSTDQPPAVGSAPVGVPPVLAWDTTEDLPEGRYAIIPRYDVKVSAGSGQLAYEAEPLDQGDAFRTNWLRRVGARRENLACVRAHGDSMEPTIYDGHSLLLDRSQKTVTDGRVYVLRYGDEIRVKRLSRRYDGALIIQSDNPRYKEEIIPPEAIDGDVEIIGRVIWAGGEM